MRLQGNVWLLLLMGLLVSVQPVHADECSDMFAEAGVVFDSAKEAVNQKDYGRAAELYEQAGRSYEEIANMKDCGFPGIQKTAQRNVEISRDAAAQARLAVQYEVAVGKYDEGNTYARNRQWDQAVAARLEAAEIWEGIGSATQSELGKNAVESARLAREAAKSAELAGEAARKASGLQPEKQEGEPASEIEDGE